MKTTGIFTTHVFEIPFNQYNKPIYVNPFGDIHHNSPSCDKDKFFEWCEEKKRLKNQYFLGIGDYLDSLSTSERRAYASAAMHDSSNERIERAFEEDTKDFIKIISFMKDKMIGMVGGNHYYTFPSGINTDQMICQSLGCRFLGVNALIRLILRYDKTHAHKIDICVHHGEGGGKTVGASMNKLQTMANSFDSDIVLQGHDHNRAVDFINRLGLTDGGRGQIKLMNRRILLGRTGSFLKGYVEGKPSYVVDAALPPSDLGTITIQLTPRREWSTQKGKRVDTRWVDINASL